MKNPFNLSVSFLEKHSVLVNLAHRRVLVVEKAAVFFAVSAKPSKHMLETKWLLLTSLVLGCGWEVTQAEVLRLISATNN